jgi:cobaltochelatase CobS
MELTSRRSLSAFQRGIVRQAVSKHPSWDSWRANVFDANGKPVNTSTISVEQLYAAADAMGIDIDETLANANAGERSERAERSERKPVASDEASQLAEILRTILSKPQIDEAAVRAIFDECLESAAPTVDESTVQALVDKALERKSFIQTIELHRPDLSKAKMEGHFHPQFATLLKAVATKRNVWIAGPTGSGKTHAARQVAEALSLSLERPIPFYLQGAMSQPHEFLGFFMVGTGKYVTTPFRQAFEFGGVVLFDECDASDSSVTLAMNAMLANGHGVFPDKPDGLAKHPDCYVIAAANTWGSGATADFVGRNKLDAAFMSRFPIKLAWYYDEAFERSLYPGPFTVKVQSARRKAAERGLKIVIDPRHSDAGNALVAAGFTDSEAADMTYLSGLTEQQRKELR